MEIFIHDKQRPLIELNLWMNRSPVNIQIMGWAKETM